MSIVRDNLMTREGYSPYCGSNEPNTCSWPRTIFDGKQFYCPQCGWRSEFDTKFIAEYKEKWGIKHDKI